MKKGVMILSLIFVMLAMHSVSALLSDCKLDATLINQDPYPAVPGEYVDLVFQVSGIESASCNGARFEVVPSYPFTLQEGSSPVQRLSGATWIKDFNKEWMVGYKLLVDQNALDNDYTLKVRYAPGNWDNESYTEDEFNVKISDLVADFEIFVNDYNFNTRELTFEILNVGKSDIQALTIEIPKQSSIDVKGANRIVVGDLDSNEYTTQDFEAILENEGDINVTITYTDEINERRTIQKTVHFDPEYFRGLSRDKTSSPIGLYIVIILGIGGYVWYRIKKSKKKKMREHSLLHSHPSRK